MCCYELRKAVLDMTVFKRLIPHAAFETLQKNRHSNITTNKVKQTKKRETVESAFTVQPYEFKIVTETTQITKTTIVDINHETFIWSRKSKVCKETQLHMTLGFVCIQCKGKISPRKRGCGRKGSALIWLPSLDAKCIKCYHKEHSQPSWGPQAVQELHNFGKDVEKLIESQEIIRSVEARLVMYVVPPSGHGYRPKYRL